VREPLYVARADRAGGGDDRTPLPRLGNHFGRCDPAVGQEHRVGERAADVDAEDRHSGRLTA
jgi:hypothetical protein